MTVYDYVGRGLVLMELFAALAGFYVWKKIKHTHWKWFPVYLLILFSAEVLAAFISHFHGRPASRGVFRFFCMPFQMLFFFWLFYREFRNSRSRYLTLIATLVFVAAYVFEIFEVGLLKGWMNSFSYTTGNVMLAGLIIVFFLRFTQSNRLLHFRSDMMFWVSTGALIFYVGSLPYYGLYNILLKEEHVNLLIIYWWVQIIFDYLMYSCFIIAFLWGKPR